MRKWFLLGVLIPVWLYGMGSPPAEETEEEKVKDPGVYYLKVGPLEKRNIFGGRVNFLPRLFFEQDGKEYRKRLDFTFVEYRLGDEVLHTATNRPFYYEADFTERANGDYPFTVRAIAKNKLTYVFQTNLIVSNVNIIVRVKTKEPVLPGYRVYVAGSASVLTKSHNDDEWDPRAIECKKIDDLTYETSFKVGLYERLEFQPTLGSWAKKARKPNGDEHRMTVRSVSRPNQVAEITVDNFGKPIGKVTAEGYVTGFVGEGKEIIITYTQPKPETLYLHYSYDKQNYQSLESQATQFCRFTVPAQWGKTLSFYVTPRKRVVTNALVLPVRKVPFKFLALGDIHANTKSKIPSLMSKEDADFVFSAGDIIASGLKGSDWGGFFNSHRPIITKFLFQTTPGNHEEESPFYPAVVGRPFWNSFSWENSYFISIDNSAPFEPGTEQYNWVVSELKKAQKYKYRFVSVHMPPYSTRKHGGDKPTLDYLCPLFEKYGVQVVFNGHEHGYEATYPLKNSKPVTSGGVVYIVAAGGGGLLYDSLFKPEWLRKENKTFHYLRVMVEKDRVYIEAVDDKQNVFDTIEVK